jgi:hypothetical protein
VFIVFYIAVIYVEVIKRERRTDKEGKFGK